MFHILNAFPTKANAGVFSSTFEDDSSIWCDLRTQLSLLSSDLEWNER